MQGALIGGRYRIQRELGRGAMGRVYQVEDLIRAGRPLALKLLAPERMQDEDVGFLAEEFKLLTQLAHPHLVRVYDFGRISGGAFFTQDLCVGESLVAAARRVLGEKPDLEDSRNWNWFCKLAVQVLQALQYIHGRGLVHGDLKPEHIIVDDRDGRVTVRLLDFGLARSAGEAGGGTPAYAAPELRAGRAGDRRADLYSLGVVFYELLGGRLPWDQGLLLDTLGDTAPEPPTPLARLNRTVSTGLSEVIGRMLAPEPFLRYPTALDVLRALQRNAAVPVETPGDQDQAPLGLEGRFIDRRKERRSILGAIQAVQERRGPRVLFIEGEAGLGKTRLMREVRYYCQLRGIPFLAGTVRPGRPYAAYAEVAEGLSLHDNMAEVLERYRMPLEVLRGTRPADAPMGSAEGFVQAVAGLVEEAGNRMPLVLHLEDLHLAEDETMDVLADLVARCTQAGSAPGGLGLVVTHRPVPAGSRLGRLREGLQGQASAELHTLDGLGVDDIAQLVGSMLGMDKAPKEVAGKLRRALDGNVAAVTEAVRDLAEDGGAQWRQGRWSVPVDWKPADRRDLRGLVSRRVAGLSADALRVLEALSLLPVEAGLGLCGRVVPSPAPALRELQARRLVDMRRRSGRRYYAPASDLVREAALANLDHARRPGLAAVLSEALEAQADGEAALEPAYRMALEAGQKVRALALGRKAVAAHRQAYAHASALALLEELGPLVEDLEPDKLLDTRREQLDLLGGLGRLDEAIDLCRSLEGLLPQAEGLFRQGAMEVWRARWALGEPLLRAALEAWEDAGDQPKWLRADILGHLAEAVFRQGRTDEAQALAEASLVGQGRSFKDKDVRAANQNIAGIIQFEGLQDDAAAERLWRHALRTARDIGVRSTQSRVLRNLSQVYGRRQQWDKAWETLEASRKILEEIGLPADLAWLAIDYTQHYAARGLHKQSLDAVKQAERAVVGVGNTERRGQVLLAMARTQRVTGGYVEALETLEHLQALGLAGYDGVAVLSRAEVALDCGAVDPARALLDQAGDLGPWYEDERHIARLWTTWVTDKEGEAAIAAWVEQRSSAPWYRQHTAGVAYEMLESQLLVRDTQAARPWFQRLVAIDCPALDVLTYQALGRGLWELLAGDPVRARGPLEQAVSRADESGLTDLAWRARGHLAEALAAIGAGREAIAVLEQAQALLEALGERVPGEYREAWLNRPPVQDLARIQARVLRQQGEDPAWRRLLEINKRLNSELDLDRLLDLVLDTAVELTEAERAFILLVEDGKQEVQRARNFDRERIQRPAHKVSWGVAQEVLRTGRPVIAMNALEDRRFRERMSVRRLGLASVIAVPLPVKGRVLGCVYLDHRREEGAFREEHADLVAAFADQAAIALDNARINARLARALDQERELTARLNDRVVRKERELAQVEALLAAGDGRRTDPWPELVGRSAAVQSVLRMLERVADADFPVLVQGESGTGKELVARAIHRGSRRASGPFVAENCAGLSGPLLASALFGHRAGAFTGADQDRQGLFQEAHGGTLFLDEVAELDPDAQARLLRVLEEGAVRPVGGGEEIPVDVRPIFATHKDLRALVAEGAFREDLYYRIHVLALRLPPLRERPEDIPLLVRHFLGLHTAGQTWEVDEAVIRRLVKHAWPGNVRELENEVRRWVALGGGRVSLDLLSESIRNPSALYPGLGAPVSRQGLDQAVASAERTVLAAALRETAGNRTRAARLLGLSRFGLQKKLQRLGMANRSN